MARKKVMFAPKDCAVPTAVIEKFRARGEQVIQESPDQPQEYLLHACDRVIFKQDEEWIVAPLKF